MATEARNRAYEAEQAAQNALNTVLQAKNDLDTIERQKEDIRGNMEVLMDNAEQTLQRSNEEWNETIALLKREPGGPQALEKVRDMIKWRNYQCGLNALAENNPEAIHKVKENTEYLISLGQRLRNQDNSLDHNYSYEDRAER